MDCLGHKRNKTRERGCSVTKGGDKLTAKTAAQTFYRPIWQLSWPVVVSNISLPLVGAVAADTKDLDMGAWPSHFSLFLRFRWMV
tara:strand:+ start:617 stop:871 length:255 start_codon:yes stop_codon:yes gene_type:complete